MVPAKSHVPKQPEGDAEAYTGALNRAEYGRQLFRDEEAATTIFLGIENSVREVRLRRSPPICLDSAFICAFLGTSPQPLFAATTPIEFPHEDYLAARARGFDRCTVGDFIAKRTDCDPADPHSCLTQGLISRADTYVDPIAYIIRLMLRLP